VATTSPPSPSLPPGAAARPTRPAPRAARLAALGALAVVVLVIAYLLFSGGGGADYRLETANASQLVLGDQVQVGGVPVGTVKAITLTSDFNARITIHVDSSLTPLHQGTTAEIRVPSLSGVANRYVALTPGPNNRPKLAAGATLTGSAVKDTVDIDQLFNIFKKETREGLRNVIQGSAQQYEGAGHDLNEGTKYFSPALASTDHIFAELTRDEHTFTEFLLQAGKALTTISAHKQQLTSLIGNADTTFQALGSEQANLARGVAELPVTLKHGNRTFAELPSTLAALEKLVNVSKPNTKTLAPFFARLRPLLSEAEPVLHNLSLAISRPGSGNDLTDAVLALPALAKSLSTSSPHSVTALQESVPITAFFAPYTPDLEGFVRDFGQGASYFDANGHYARISAIFDGFAPGANGNLKPVTPQQGLQGLNLQQLRRCPGAAADPPADGSAPFTDNGQLDCDPTELSR
jgi:phospholipid/cholesterol/gamma-HCH transport system substrate-binding protein